MEYLTQVRMERACELLKCTSYRTSEIGEQVGYNDSHYFSSAFKKAMGQSPKEYKASQTRQSKMFKKGGKIWEWSRGRLEKQKRWQI